jgi:hypothetical protein
LLWQTGNVYLMDNHRAALWCWQQQVDLYAQPHSLIHIDRHYDALSANLDAHLAAMPNLRGLSVRDYLSATLRLYDTTPLFRWDNYVSIYLAAFATQLGWFRCLTHEDGDKPVFRGLLESPPYDLPENLDYWLRQSRGWIVNIDLDYFYCRGPGEDEYLPLFSDDFIDKSFAALRGAMDAGLVAVVTVCLTPSHFTPGWDACLALSRRIFEILGARHPEI